MLGKAYKIIIVTIISFIFITAIVKTYQGPPDICQDKEYVVNDNIHYFETVKNYFLEQGIQYYTVREDYKEVIKDIEVVDAITYILEELEYDMIECIQTEKNNNPYIIFIKGIKSNIETGIIYTKNESKYRYVMDEISGDWHFHGHLYPYSYVY